MRIAIIGGGIGGLAAALQLLKTGFDVHVYERAAAIGEIGAGIQISPNASRLLVRLGLKPAMDKVGVRPLAAAAGVFEVSVLFYIVLRRRPTNQPRPASAEPSNASEAGSGTTARGVEVATKEAGKPSTSAYHRS